MLLSFKWNKNSISILDQRLLPHKLIHIRCKTHKEVADCIKNMAIRGAPAIGCVAAFGLSLVPDEKKFTDKYNFLKYFLSACQTLKKSRPTAINLFWAVDRMKLKLQSLFSSVNLSEFKKILYNEAESIYKEDLNANLTMSKFGTELLKKKSVVITHCNTGSLATSGYGTALGVIRYGWKTGKIKKVYVDETRPYLQGARLTVLELKIEKIPHQLICDNMAAHIMKTEKIDAVIVGADRVASNGDTANKIGTYNLAVLAQKHKIPFYVVCPTSTIDLSIKTGDEIPIEERSVDEVLYINKISIAPIGTKARHPAFDVTPNNLITAIITEKGVATKPFKIFLKKLLC